MSEICPVCGLPKELCICGTIEKEEQRIKVYTTKRRFGKTVTIIEGIDKNNAKDVVKQLKRKLACGGTFKDGRIELQGDHKNKVKDLLVKLGYNDEQIEVL